MLSSASWQLSDLRGVQWGQWSGSHTGHLLHEMCTLGLSILHHIRSHDPCEQRAVHTAAESQNFRERSGEALSQSEAWPWQRPYVSWSRVASVYRNALIGHTHAASPSTMKVFFCFVLFLEMWSAWKQYPLSLIRWKVLRVQPINASIALP